METITIKLREGRTVSEVYSDIAVYGWYNPTIIENIANTTQAMTQAEALWYVYPDNIINGSKKSFTQLDNTVILQYDTEEITDNPITEQEFGKAIVQKSFWSQDAEAESIAVKIRSEKEYNEM